MPSRAGAFAAASLAAALAGTVVAPPPAAAAERTVVLTGHATVAHGASATLTAVLYDGYRKIPGAVLAVQERTSANAPWAAAGTATTAADGRAAIRVRPVQNTDYRIVHAPAGQPPAASADVPVHVAPAASLRTDRTTVARDGTAVLAGTVRPAAAVARVLIEWRGPDGRWTTRATAPVAADGTWRRPLVHGLPGTAVFRARTEATARHTQGLSPAATVAVRRDSTRALPEWLYPYLHRAVPPSQVPSTNIPGCRPSPGLTHFGGTLGWTVYGTDRADTLCGLPGDTTLVALAGNDTVRLGGDPGPVIGEEALLGPGDDTATVEKGYPGGPGRYPNSPSVSTGAVHHRYGGLQATRVPLPWPVAWRDTGLGNDTIRCLGTCSNAVEGPGDDRIYGPPAAALFHAEGGPGNDILFGSAGFTTLDGGPGNDILADPDPANGTIATGGPGNDLAVLRDGNAGAVDTFHGEDRAGPVLEAGLGPCSVAIQGEAADPASVSCPAGPFTARLSANGTVELSYETALGTAAAISIADPRHSGAVRARLTVARDACACDREIRNRNGVVISPPDIRR